MHGIFHLIALGITHLLTSVGRYAPGLAIRSVLRTHSHELLTRYAALMQGSSIKGISKLFI